MPQRERGRDRDRERNGGAGVDSRCEIAWSVTRLGEQDAVAEDAKLQTLGLDRPNFSQRLQYEVQSMFLMGLC